MKKTKKLILVTVAAALMAAPAAAQQPTEEEINQYIELVRMDVRQGRAELVGQSMRLSAAQAATFWPIYEEYEKVFMALGDTELQLILDYAQAFDSMTDATADGLVERLFQLIEDDQALIREYHGKLSSALGGAIAARFVQVERRIKTLLDLRLAADIPLLEPPR